MLILRNCNFEVKNGYFCSRLQFLIYQKVCSVYKNWLTLWLVKGEICIWDFLQFLLLLTSGATKTWLKILILGLLLLQKILGRKTFFCSWQRPQRPRSFILCPVINLGKRPTFLLCWHRNNSLGTKLYLERILPEFFWDR